jgi:prepilin-type N-terminal cleavage/methylation domain-containing protein/prepilin-type processing-associated H-X9-DG protein
MSATHRRPRRLGGFTLVELLVVIAIIGVLVALLLPAVQAAREAARRASCLNNIKNVALGVIGYHDARRQFPPGFAVHGIQVPAWAWTTYTLPYLEQQGLFNSLNPPKQRLADFLNAAKTDSRLVQLAQTPLSIFRCPSDDTPDLLPNDGVPLGLSISCPGDPKCQRNFDTPSFTPPAFQPATSNYIGNRGFTDAGCQPSRPWRCQSSGILYGGSEINEKHVTDGLSNTFLLGERDGYCWAGTWLGIRNADGPNMFSSYYALGRVSVQLNHPSNLDGDCTEGFSSKHAGGAVFAFCDGSVHFINEDVNFDNGANEKECSVEEPPPGTPNVVQCFAEQNGRQIGVFQRLGWRDDQLPISGY